MATTIVFVPNITDVKKSIMLEATYVHSVGYRAIESEQAFRQITVFTRAIERNCIIVCEEHLDYFLLNEQCFCEWEDERGH